MIYTKEDELYGKIEKLEKKNKELEEGIRRAIRALYGEAGGSTDTEMMNDCEEILRKLTYVELGGEKC